jgi:DUF3085 family protein
MGRLVFKADDVRRVVEHSLNAPAQGEMLVDYVNDKPVTKPVEAPSLLLVHDHGVYLMSNGQPRDLVSGTSSFCAYAHGCDPKQDAQWWDVSRALVGGDDFGETLPWAADIKALLDAGGKEIVIDVFGNNIELLKEQPKKKRKA